MNGKKINYQLLLRRICLIVLDIFLIIISSAMALATRFEFDFGQIPEEFISVIRDYGVLMILVTLLCFAVFGYTAACGNMRVRKKLLRLQVRLLFHHFVKWQLLWVSEAIFREVIMCFVHFIWQSWLEAAAFFTDWSDCAIANDSIIP